MIKVGINESVKAIEDYVSWLKDVRSKLKPETAKSFRIGKDLYEKKFQYDIVSQFTAEEIYKKAIQRKDEIQTEMLTITKKIFNKYFPNVRISGHSNETVKMLIDEISKKHVKAEDVQTEIEKQ